MHPNRYAFYDKNEQRILPPGEAQEKGLTITPEGNVYGRRDKNVTAMTMIAKHVVPLASTGLKDGGDYEIAEGHLLRFPDDEKEVPRVVIWKRGRFVLIPGSTALANRHKNGEIVGHVLTEPDQAPPKFSVKDYFETEV